MAEEVVRFDVTFSVEDVIKVQEALMKWFKAGKDEPIKTVGLALCVAEIKNLNLPDKNYFQLALEVAKNEFHVNSSEGWSFFF